MGPRMAWDGEGRAGEQLLTKGWGALALSDKDRRHRGAVTSRGAQDYLTYLVRHVGALASRKVQDPFQKVLGLTHPVLPRLLRH